MRLKGTWLLSMGLLLFAMEMLAHSAEPDAGQEATTYKLDRMGCIVRTENDGLSVIYVPTSRTMLYGGKFPDAVLEHLKRLKNLQSLNLSYTQITDMGLEHLKELKKLQSLCLDPNISDLERKYAPPRTPFTDEGVKRLRQTLPDCKIEH